MKNHIYNFSLTKSKAASILAVTTQWCAAEACLGGFPFVICFKPSRLPSSAADKLSRFPSKTVNGRDKSAPAAIFPSKSYNRSYPAPIKLQSSFPSKSSHSLSRLKKTQTNSLQRRAKSKSFQYQSKCTETIRQARYFFHEMSTWLLTANYPSASVKIDSFNLKPPQ